MLEFKVIHHIGMQQPGKRQHQIKINSVLKQ